MINLILALMDLFKFVFLKEYAFKSKGVCWLIWTAGEPDN